MKTLPLVFLGIFSAFTTAIPSPSPCFSSANREPSPTPLPLHSSSMEEEQKATLHTNISKLAASPSPSTNPESSSTPLGTKLSPPSGEDKQPALRAKALELAGGFSNDGYKIRDGFWLSQFPPLGQTSLLAVNLFAGNQYWFCVATSLPAKRIELKLYNEKGHPVSTQSYEKNLTAALGVEPSASGKYYLSVQLLEGSPAPFCVLYTYK